MIKANPERKFVLLNRFKYDSNNLIDNKILELLNKGKQK